MDEIWERAVEMAVNGQTDVDSVRSLTLDGAVKCVHGRLPSPWLFEKFHNLQHLSMASIGVSSLEQFPRLRNLQKLILSDNRIAGGLEFLVEAALESLRDLDLSNNRISDINVLKPLAELRLVSLDLYECPVTRVKDYRSRVFGLIRSLKYLDKMDVEENERPESDEEEEEEEEDDEDDPGSGEIDCEDHLYRLRNGERVVSEGVVDVDEDEESDADGEEAKMSRRINGLNKAGSSHHPSNGFRVEPVDRDSEEEEDDDSDDEVYEDDDSEDEELTEVHEIGESDDGEEGGLEDDDDEEHEDEEELDTDEIDFVGPESRLTSTDGEIDAHEQGEDDDVETGEEEQDAIEEDGDFEDDEDEEDEYGLGYLVQPVERMGGVEVSDAGEGEGEDEDEDDGELLPSSSSHKRKRDGNGDEER